MKTDAEYLAEAEIAADKHPWREHQLVPVYGERARWIASYIAVARNLDRGIDRRRKHPAPQSPFLSSFEVWNRMYDESNAGAVVGEVG